jgi:hypothetical protein
MLITCPNEQSGSVKKIKRICFIDFSLVPNATL